ncbi:hypothetical protein BDN71DRAFT_1433668 [Pleurotus eryngii]|uniref:Uncharacterized protein n=1 Tax=Pleurotus eryngii TaxID=5323 RepID=A0A9P5ZPI0_PLEER|nr:hypothetical protein BDN71DRAFT_1433668 [Pleurotus eryngii]
MAVLDDKMAVLDDVHWVPIRQWPSWTTCVDDGRPGRRCIAENGSPGQHTLSWTTYVGCISDNGSPGRHALVCPLVIISLWDAYQTMAVLDDDAYQTMAVLDDMMAVLDDDAYQTMAVLDNVHCPGRRELNWVREIIKSTVT